MFTGCGWMKRLMQVQVNVHSNVYGESELSVACVECKCNVCKTLDWPWTHYWCKLSSGLRCSGVATDQSEAELQLSGRGLDQWEARIPLSPSSSSICAGICSSEISTETQHCSCSIPSNLPIPASGRQTLAPTVTRIPGENNQFCKTIKVWIEVLQYQFYSFKLNLILTGILHYKPGNPALILSPSVATGTGLMLCWHCSSCHTQAGTGLKLLPH